MNTSTPADTLPSKVTLQSIKDLLQSAGGRTIGKFAGLTVRSHFQPIYSVAHSRTVRFEGLVRAADVNGYPVAPLDAFKTGKRFEHVLTLDRLADAVHLRNFLDLKADGWLFLNMNTDVLLASV